jgi:enterochelin esterase-like enzyme
MKYVLVLLLAAGVPCWLEGADDSVPAPSNMAFAAATTVRSPEPPEGPRIHPDGRVTFRLKGPGLRSVQVLPHNDDNGLGKGPFDMVRGEDGIWTYTTQPVVPGLHYYTLIVDGLEINDPGSQTVVRELRTDSFIEVPEKGVDFYALKDVAHGELRAHWYFSKVTQRWRRVFVYTPPGYDQSGKTRYPVLYLQHGATENETTWTVLGRANFIMDNLLAEGKAKPMIVVMDTGYANPPGEPPPPGPGPGFRLPSAFPEVMIGELIPMIDGYYRTLADREHRAMAGLSMGGMQTAQIALTHLDKFSYIGFFSGPILNFDLKTSYGGVFADAAAFNKKVKLLWIGAGTAEPRIHDMAMGLHETLDKAGVKNTFWESQGTAHEFQTWRRDLHEFAPLLFR